MRGGEAPPVTLSPVWGDKLKQENSMAPGDLSRDLSQVVRRHPGTESVILARSEAALLSGEEIPTAALPESPETGLTPGLVACDWESPIVREVEAADLALEDLVRAHAKGRERSPDPTVNIFGPPIFSPNAAAEYDEAERLLDFLARCMQAHQRLGMETDAAVAVRGDAERERNQLLGLLVERAVAGCRLGERGECLHGVGNAAAQLLQVG